MIEHVPHRDATEEAFWLATNVAPDHRALEGPLRPDGTPLGRPVGSLDGPINTVRDAAVFINNNGRVSYPTGGDIDTIFVWSTETAKSFHTRIGGTPFRPASRLWPTTENGEPAVFLFQLYCCPLLCEELSLPPLPGNLLLVFDLSRPGPKHYKSAGICIGDEFLHFEWYSLEDLDANECIVRAKLPSNCKLPWQVSARTVRMQLPKTWSFADLPVASRLGDRFRSEEYNSDDVKTSENLGPLKLGTLVPFAQIASLNSPAERSNFFRGTHPTVGDGESRFWARWRCGPFLIGDLFSILLCQDKSDRVNEPGTAGVTVP